MQTWQGYTVTDTDDKIAESFTLRYGYPPHTIKRHGIALAGPIVGAGRSEGERFTLDLGEGEGWYYWHAGEAIGPFETEPEADEDYQAVMEPEGEPKEDDGENPPESEGA